MIKRIWLVLVLAITFLLPPVYASITQHPFASWNEASDWMKKRRFVTAPNKCYKLDITERTTKYWNDTIDIQWTCGKSEVGYCFVGVYYDPFDREAKSQKGVVMCGLFDPNKKHKTEVIVPAGHVATLRIYKKHSRISRFFDWLWFF